MTADTDMLRASPRSRVSRSGRGGTKFWVLTVLLSLVVGVVAAAIAVAVVAGVRQTTYQSTAVLLIDQPAGIAISDNPSELQKLVNLRAKYTEIASTLVFADRVSALSGLPAGTVHSDVYSTLPNGSLLFDLGARSTDRQQAYSVAQAVVSGMVSYVNHEQQATGIKKEARLVVRVLTPTQPPVSATPSRSLGIGIVVGVIAFLLMLGLQSLRLRS